MREILFRGKRIDNGEWVEGFYCQRENYIKGGTEIEHRIVVPCANSYSGARWIDVNPSTVGQYTGLTDKNGKKIFEGDITSLHIEEEDPEDDSYAINKVVFSRGAYTLFPDGTNDGYDLNSFLGSNFEVIGNIHDNPDRLKGVYND